MQPKKRKEDRRKSVAMKRPKSAAIDSERRRDKRSIKRLLRDCALILAILAPLSGCVSISGVRPYINPSFDFDAHRSFYEAARALQGFSIGVQGDIK